jgi:hypothetical protein
LYREADVDRELEHEPLPVGADVGRASKDAEDRLDPRVRVLVAADHNRQGAALDLGHAARYRGVEHLRATSLIAHTLGDRAACARADRAQVRPDLPLAQPPHDAVRPRSDRLDDVVVWEGGQDDVGRLGERAGRVDPMEALID